MIRCNFAWASAVMTIAVFCVILSGCANSSRKQTEKQELLQETEQETEMASPFTVFVDGEPFTEMSVNPESDDDVRVYISWDGLTVLDLPFGETHTVLIRQINGLENTVELTGEAVFMETSNCDGQDCVSMGEITRENLETRVLGGFIICLPNRIVVEVRSK